MQEETHNHHARGNQSLFNEKVGHQEKKGYNFWRKYLPKGPWQTT